MHHKVTWYQRERESVCVVTHKPCPPASPTRPLTVFGASLLRRVAHIFVSVLFGGFPGLLQPVLIQQETVDLLHLLADWTTTNKNKQSSEATVGPESYGGILLGYSTFLPTKDSGGSEGSNTHTHTLIAGTGLRRLRREGKVRYDRKDKLYQAGAQNS